MSYSIYFGSILKNESVIAIELRDTEENIFERLIFSGENDHGYGGIAKMLMLSII